MRAARSSFSWPHGLCYPKEITRGRHAFYLAAAFQIRTKWIGALFTYVRHSVLPRHSYDLASYTVGWKNLETAHARAKILRLYIDITVLWVHNFGYTFG